MRASAAKQRTWCGFGAVLAVLFLLNGCGRQETDLLQGYVEGEFVYIASPSAGNLRALSVQRGDRVPTGAPLYALDEEPEKQARNEAERRVAQARANLEDAKKGRRPTEIDSIRAQIKASRAALTLSEKDFERRQELFQSKAVSAQEFDRARAARDQDRQRVQQLEADLETAQLGARSDQIAAAEANLNAMEAALAQAQWSLAQKSRTAPEAGLVFDTLYRQGEWVAAGRPVVVLLPPRNIKVRTFVAETKVGAIRPGERVQVTVDGVAEPFFGKVSYISPRAEYTPPVIYSRESRQKLMFMIEAVFDPQAAAQLHPGQPVDVRFLPQP